ncbi:hypothetical protein GQF56_20930 [Rhodobacter sphaeroides]|uniref:hypothetical protein n=1 Tax=Cereibacter sphaeroides TaxID=1063 RepID=UPI0009B6338C|nr:hypothetical protein [Cereibacter sphaeroides]AXC64209.1 hypothetical protein DQL45_22740 [Cereibacter sphaeroides 2.4.1]MVX50244.1 hypothetical protein [Cereibacter sphaeroides]MVX50301.1 hypothetical protein [Cereibacter sphaeroides]QJC86932.1 hypothetical protein HGN32_22320 [Cereibacter sphaeroides]
MRNHAARALHNRNVRNLLAEALPPRSTVPPDSTILPRWREADHHRQAGTTNVLVLGERYGMGSSRDWATEGPALLGVHAVLAVGFDRIHRANLIVIGIPPVKLPPGITPEGLGLRGTDEIEVVMTCPMVTIHRCDGRVDALCVRLAAETSLVA